MDDYIFLLIAIGLSIFGAISQNKKKKNQPLKVVESEEEESSEKFFMDKFFEDDFMNESVEEIPAPAKLKPVLAKEPLIVPASNHVINIYKPGFIRTLPDRKLRSMQSIPQKQKTEIQETEIQADENPGIIEDFSLRKAFIYSEILTRKY